MKKGSISLVLGTIGLIWVYSMRPPSGFGEAFMMGIQGKNSYLKEPVYLSLMTLGTRSLIMYQSFGYSFEK